jgi:oligoribonuclease NrnB/cAMP/cGMP phosphodiesterase (DHH superfamily)
MPTLIIYHSRCADGWMSAFLAYLALNKTTARTLADAEFVAANYGDAIPDLTGKDVYILDFSYDPELLMQAAVTAKSVLLLDHHKSALLMWANYCAQDSEGFDFHETTGRFKKGPLDVRFDLTRSGAGLALAHWQDQIESNLQTIYGTSGLWVFTMLQLLVAAIEDRDLWRFKLPNTREICAAWSLAPQDFYEADVYLATSTLNMLIKQGEVVLKRDRLIHESIAQRANDVFFEDFVVPLVNCNKNFTSEVGHILAKDRPFSVSYEFMGNEAVVSLRSTDQGEDVSFIAQRFGGGGHRNAAGFKLHMSDFLSVFMFSKPIVSGWDEINSATPS